MNKLILYATLLAIAVVLPVERTDLGKLKPAESVMIYKDSGNLVIETDTEDLGRGETLNEALQNLKDTTSGTVYLDTVDYLLIEKGVEPWIPELASYLKDDVRICYALDGVEIAKVASYLSVHTPEMTIENWSDQAKLQTLSAKDGRMNLS